MSNHHRDEMFPYWLILLVGGHHIKFFQTPTSFFQKRMKKYSGNWDGGEAVCRVSPAAIPRSPAIFALQLIIQTLLVCLYYWITNQNTYRTTCSPNRDPYFDPDGSTFLFPTSMRFKSLSRASFRWNSPVAQSPLSSNAAENCPSLNLPVNRQVPAQDLTNTSGYIGCIGTCGCSIVLQMTEEMMKNRIMKNCMIAGVGNVWDTFEGGGLRYTGSQVGYHGSYSWTEPNRLCLAKNRERILTISW